MPISPARCSKTPSPPLVEGIVRNVRSLQERFTYDEAAVLGRGAYSTVYLSRRRAAEDPSGRHDVLAIKIASKSDRVDPIVKQECRILREVHRLGVPKCAHLVEALQTPDQWALVLSTVEDCADAKTVVGRYGALSEWAAASVIRQLLTALGALHEAGILHRDVTMENVLLGGGGDDATARAWVSTAVDPHPVVSDHKRDCPSEAAHEVEKVPVACSIASRREPDVLLVDFGFARHANRDERGRSGHRGTPEDGGTGCVKPRSYTPCGSIKYLPAEVLDLWSKGHETSLVATVEQAMSVDMFAVGVVAHILLSAHYPFGGHTKREIASQQRTVGQNVCTSRAWKGVSEPAKEFIRGLMAVDPTRRWTARQALAHEWLKCEGNKP